MRPVHVGHGYACGTKAKPRFPGACCGPSWDGFGRYCSLNVMTLVPFVTLMPLLTSGPHVAMSVGALVVAV